MIPIYICDDDPSICREIANIVEKQILIMNYDMGPVRTAYSPESLLASMEPGAVPAIYFLDVDFQEAWDGFTLGAEIRKRDPRGFLLYITGHADLAFETFRYRLEAMDYIVKGEETLPERISACLASVQQRLLDDPGASSPYFTLKLFDTIRNIPLDQILFFEAIGQKHRIRLVLDDEIMEFYGSLKEMEKDLGEGFFRSHRGYLVNRKRIAKIHLREGLVEFDNGQTCLLSRKAKGLLQ